MIYPMPPPIARTQQRNYAQDLAQRGSLNLDQLSNSSRQALEGAGVSETDLQSIAGNDRVIRGDEFEQLFSMLEGRADTSSRRSGNVNRAEQVYQAIRGDVRSDAPSNAADPTNDTNRSHTDPSRYGVGLRGDLTTGRPPRSAQSLNGSQGSDSSVAQANDPNYTPPAAPDSDNRLQDLERRANRYTNDPAVFSDTDMARVRDNLSAARTATAAGDYEAAAEAYEQLGFPIDDISNMSEPQSSRAWATMVMIGASNVTETDDGYQFGSVRTGSGGNQQVNDLNGLAANAEMMHAMTDAGFQPDNPPTQAQAESYMRHVASQNPNNPQAVMDAASMLTDGLQVHYSSAGQSDPNYGTDTNYVFVDEQGERHSFDNQTEARAAAREAGVPSSQIRGVRSRSPDSWSDAMSKGTRAGRTIGDCESKLCLQAHLLQAAGMEELGSINVGHGNATGHMLGVARANDGSVFITSNEDSYAVNGTGPDGAVTNADIDRVAREAIRDVYGRESDDALRGFTFTSAPRRADTTEGAGVQSMREAQENEIARISEDILP